MTETRKNAWQEWLESDEGRDCSNFDTLTAKRFLENRLWYAFLAGMNAASLSASRPPSQPAEPTGGDDAQTPRSTEEPSS